MLVKVAIDLSLDRLFTYEVPEEQAKKLAIGQLLSVPFGHRMARGFALELLSDPLSAVGSCVPRAGAGGVPGLPAHPTPPSNCGPAARMTLPSPPLPPRDRMDDGLVVGGGFQPPRDAPATNHQRTTNGAFVLKPIAAILDETPFFSPALLRLVGRVAAYVAAPIESVLRAALPAAVLKKNAHPRELLYVEAVSGDAPAPALTKRQCFLLEQIVRLGGGWMGPLCEELQTTPATLRALAARGLVTIEARAKRRNPLGRGHILPSRPLPLNPEQAAALATIVSAPKPVLLFGVTGSGKTEVYLQAIARELEQGRGAIVMVPEIALTPQTVQRFASRFGDRVAVLHSALSDGERYDEWHRIRDGRAQVVVGPRSAVWAPVQRLGLIVVDEEHETSYKQTELPRYHARDVAVLRGAVEGARVVLGSATPSLESWMNVRRGKYALATLKRRAGAGTLPRVNLVEMTDGAIFSRDLLEAISLRLDRHEQTILFLNRRGYSRALVCATCGHVVTCPNCDLPYTYHQADRCLRCHVCGGWALPPDLCPNCHTSTYTYQGVGTQRAEAALARCFREARILRMDADSTSRKSSHDDILGAFRRHEADILIGTQMIAKGLDFPNVTLVGVLNADSSLYMPDFRAAERTFQLLAQVSGRAGRAELPGEVFIQTHDPAVPVIQAARFNDYECFAERELKEREEAFFPPFCHLAVISVRSRDLALAGDWAGLYAASLQKVPSLTVSEAMPSALEKADGWYRWQVVVRAPTAAQIARAWRWIAEARPAPKEVHIALDIDAYDLV